MVRKKNSKALFEVLSQGRGAVQVPDWIKNKPEDQAENQPDTEPPKDEPPKLGDQTEVELVDAEEPTIEDMEIVEPEEEVPAESIDEENEDQSVAETTDAELFTTEEDATDDASDTFAEIIEIDEIEDDEPDDADEADEVVIEDVIPRIRRKPPYDVPRDNAPDLPMRQDEPLVQVQDGQIRISMTRVGAMIALGAVLVLLVAAFAFGLAVGRPGSGETAEWQQKPLLKGVHIAGTKVPQTPADSDQGVLVDAGKRTPGRYYFIFEKINGTSDVDRVDASNMVTLFRERELPSQLVNIAKPGQPQRWALWGLHGFENPDSEAAKKYVDDIKRVGEEYFRKYGKYECKNSYPLKKRKSGN